VPCTGHFCAAERDKNALIRKNSAENPDFGNISAENRAFLCFSRSFFAKKANFKNENLATN
jgi:hypothetical protein